MPTAARAVQMLMEAMLEMVKTRTAIAGAMSKPAALVTGMVQVGQLILVLAALAVPRVPMTHPTARRMSVRRSITSLITH